MAFYSIKPRAAANPQAAEIFIYGDIGNVAWDESTTTAANFVRDLGEIEASQITIRINSFGGSVVDGIAIHNAIRRHPATVHTEIDGIAYSIASLIAMAGDTRGMAENARLMIHAPWSIAFGNAKEMRDTADELDQYAKMMAGAYVTATGKSEADVLALLTDGEDHYYNASDALAEGFVTELTDATPVAASAHKLFDLSRYQQRVQTTAAAAATPQEQHMPHPAKPPAVAPQAAPQQTEADIRAATLRDEQQRRKDVSAHFNVMKGYDLGDLKAACLEDVKCTPQAAGEKILAKLAEGAEPLQAPRIDVIEDERDVKRAAAVDAILARAGVAGVDAGQGNPYRGQSLYDMARSSVEASGKSTAGMDRMAVVGAAFTQSTSDFPILLEDAMHKALQTAYEMQRMTWDRFCATGGVSDFREHKRYRLGSLGNLSPVNENGEFKNKTIPDGERSGISADTKGMIINLSRQMVINDDLGAFIGLAQQGGRAAARTVEADVYALLGLNGGLGPIMSDGKTLFHAAHGNLDTAAALSVEAIESGRVKMASQKDPSDEDYLDIRPRSILVPMSLGGTARVINEAQYDPDTADKLQRPNMVRGLFEDVIDTPRMTGTRFYLFADPQEVPTIEVAFLDSQQTPFLDMQDGFDVDGTRYKVRLDYGVAAIDYRGAVTNAGKA